MVNQKRLLSLFTLSILFVFAASFAQAVQVEYTTKAQQDKVVTIAGADDYEKALLSYNDGEIEAAYIHLKNTLKNNVDHIPGKILMGKILLINGYFIDATLVLYEALALGGDITLIIPLLGESLLYERRFDELFALSHDYRLTSELQFHWQMQKARAYGHLRDLTNELQAYKLALRYSAASTNKRSINVNSALHGLVAFYIKTGKFKQANILLIRAFDISPDDYLSWHLQGQLFKQQQDHEQALKAFNYSLSLNPDYLDSKRALVSLHMESGANNQAIIMVDEILEETPDDPRARLLKAKLLLAKRDNSDDSKLAKEILGQLSQQISQVPEQVLLDNDWILFINGITAYLLDNYESAIRNLIQYQTNNADNFHATLMIAHSYLKVGQRSLAREILDRNLDKVVKNLEAALLLCDLYIESNKGFKCESIIVNLKKSFPNFTTVLLAEARVLYSRKQLSEAITLIEQANNKQNDLQFESYLLELYMAADQYHKAGRLVTKLLVEHPDDIALLNVMAAALIKINQPKQAYQVLEHLLNLDAHHFAAKYNQASALLDLKRPQQAKKRLLTLIKIKPKHIQSRLLLAKTEIALGNSLGAIEVLNKLLQLDKRNIAGHEMLVQLFKLTGQYEQALNRLSTLLKSDRLSGAYLLIKVEIFLAMGERTQAKKQMDILKGIWNDDAQDLITLARLQRRAHDLTGARISLNRALEIAPKLNELAFADAKLSIYEKNTETAEKKISQLKGNNIQNSQVVMLEGDLFLSRRKAEAAQTSYLKAFELNNNNGMALAKAYNLAISGFQKDDFEQQLVNTLNKQQSNFYYRNMFADFLLLEQRYAEAKQQYLRIFRLKALPNRADVLNNLAFASMFDDLEAAEIYAQQASELKPASSAILDTFGWILATKTKFEQALSVLRKASSIDASDASIRYHLAYTLHHVGRDKEAIVELEYAIQSQQNFAERKAAEELLNSL